MTKDNKTERKIYVAADHRGVDLRDEVVQLLLSVTKYKVENIGIRSGSSLDYIDISKILADKLLLTDDAGIIICRSGQGLAISLNRFNHIRACMCRNSHEARNMRKKLNANVLCLGSDYSNSKESLDIIDAFLQQEFIGGKHLRCVEKLGYKQTMHNILSQNFITRAIIVYQDHILLTKASRDNVNYPADVYFLPGGHIEHNETASLALQRELKEEINLEVDSMYPKGILECSWERNGKIYHEFNVVFVVKAYGLNIAKPPCSIDNKGQIFVWKRISEIETLNILPFKLKEIILNKNFDFYSQMIGDLI